MYLVFIYYAYMYNVLHFILNKSINQSVSMTSVLVILRLRSHGEDLGVCKMGSTVGVNNLLETLLIT